MRPADPGCRCRRSSAPSWVSEMPHQEIYEVTYFTQQGVRRTFLAATESAVEKFFEREVLNPTERYGLQEAVVRAMAVRAGGATVSVAGIKYTVTVEPKELWY